MRRWRGLKALAHNAVDRVTELVEEGHESTARSVVRVISAVPGLEKPVRVVDGIRRASTKGTLLMIRAVNRAVEVVSDAGLDAADTLTRERELKQKKPDAPAHEASAVAMRSDAVGTRSWVFDAVTGLVNGAIGDHLHESGNGLDLGMAFRYGDVYLPQDVEAARSALAGASPKLVVFVHGLATTEWSWCLESQAYHGEASASFGSMLTRDLGYTSIYARYNTGRHVSENGRLLARAMQRLIDAYPEPLPEIVLVGHSMGGLVVRSACHYAALEGLPWASSVRRVFCLGSPHGGAPLERISHVAAAALGAIDTPGTRIPARLLEGRSAGIKDLRFGSLVDEDWRGIDPDALADAKTRSIPLLDHVSYSFISATVTADPAHPLGQIVGDLLVRVPSASGPPLQRSTFPVETRTYGGVLHHQLQNHPAVYALIRAACAG